MEGSFYARENKVKGIVVPISKHLIAFYLNSCMNNESVKNVKGAYSFSHLMGQC